MDLKSIGFTRAGSNPAADDQTTFKNARPQRLYRERSQLQRRSHLGLLEKHKDYKERAVNYQQKQTKLKNLQLKAALRNKDEFNFRMTKGQLKDGKHIEADSSDDDENFDAKEYQKIVKTQNQNLLKVQYAINDKQVQRIQSIFHDISGPKQNSHKFFVQDEDEVEKFDLSKHSIEHIQNENAKVLKKKLEDAIKKRDKMKGFYLKLDQEKNLLTNQKKKIKKLKTGKSYRFMYERKK